MSHYKGYGNRKKNEIEALTTTPQNQPIPGANQKMNNAGGMVFTLDPIDQLRRFLILGSSSSTYYASEKTLTRDNLKNLFTLLKDGRGKEAVDVICEISEAGRAPKNDPALFALAFCVACDVHGKSAHKVLKDRTYKLHRQNHEKLFEHFSEENVEKTFGKRKMVRRGDTIYATVVRTEKSPAQVMIDDPRDIEVRQYALANRKRVIRTGTHLLHFLAYVEQFRGWGRSLRDAIANHFNDDEAKHVAFQVLKYQQRDGFSQRDVLRLAHPKAQNETHNTVYHWVTQGWPDVGEDPHPDESLRQIWAYEHAKKAKSSNEIVALIEQYKLPREAIPGEWLNDASVWGALLRDMPMEAMVRNLGNMTKIGLIAPGSDATKLVVARLNDVQAILKARLHPIKVLTALKTYESGSGMKSTWTPVGKVVDALDEAFYHAFGTVTPTNKRMMLALDVSGSMSWGEIAGMKGITPRVASAALSLVTARTEQDYTIMGFSHTLVPITISPRQRLDDVVKSIERIPMGGTDCSLPMLWALQNKVKIDSFVVYTDSETWYDKQKYGHPCEVLKKYRQAMGIPARLAVVGMTATEFTIADQTDAGMMDFVGFDSAGPELLSQFLRGEM